MKPTLVTDFMLRDSDPKHLQDVLDILVQIGVVNRDPRVRSWVLNDYQITYDANGEPSLKTSDELLIQKHPALKEAWDRFRLLKKLMEEK